MILDCKSVSKKMLNLVKTKNMVLRMKGVYPSFCLIRNSNESYHKYYLSTLKRYAKDCEIKLDIEDMFNSNTEELIKIIDKYNANFNTHGILLEKYNQTLINDIVPFKDLDASSIPNLGSLMVNNETLLPVMVKSILDLFNYKKIDLKNNSVLILDDENNHYMKILIEILRRKGANISIVNNNTKNISSFFYSANIILIANNKKSSIGYDLLEDVNNYNRENIIHGIDKPITLLLDLNIHELKNGDLTGNIQYNNVDEIYKYAQLEFIEVMPSAQYIKLALISLLSNVLICSDIQHSMLKKTMSGIN